MKCKVFLGIFALVLLFSCETARQFTVETLTPTSVFYPVNSPRVVIVNNAVVQPADNGVEFYLDNMRIRCCELKKDSTIKKLIYFWANGLDWSDHFDEVLVYNYPLRTDDSFLASPPIHQDTAQKIANEVNADALLIVDRLLFRISQQVIGRDVYYSSSVLTCEGVFSVYLPDKKKITQTLILVDTLQHNRFAGTDTTMFLKWIPEHLLQLSTMRMAKIATMKFAPYWEYSERQFYTGPDSQLKTAYAYANKKRWPQAIEIWTRIYNSESNNKRRGKAAINIAVAEELNTGYTSAISWVDKALSAYAKEKADKVQEELQFATDYKKKLETLRSQLLN